MRVKICGLTKGEQAVAIADLGATALGFICVPQSPRYVTPEQIRAISRHLPPEVARIGVFAGEKPQAISRLVAEAELTGVQLHGGESPLFCQQVRQLLPGIELIKALRVQTADSLGELPAFFDWVDTLLLDAYHPQQLGGTGKTLNWETLAQFSPPLPWLLAGGLTPDNIPTALSYLSPSGIDLSSGVERAPGDKDLGKVARLFEQLSLSLASTQD